MKACHSLLYFSQRGCFFRVRPQSKPDTTFAKKTLPKPHIFLPATQGQELPASSEFLLVSKSKNWK